MVYKRMFNKKHDADVVINFHDLEYQITKTELVELFDIKDN